MWRVGLKYFLSISYQISLSLLWFYEDMLNGCGSGSGRRARPTESQEFGLSQPPTELELRTAHTTTRYRKLEGGWRQTTMYRN